MPTTYTRPTRSAPPAGPPQLAPQPPIAPVTPPVRIVDLMTASGSVAFGARWKGMEAKIVTCPALSDSMPEFKTTYDVEPHAELLGYDDAAWPEIAANETRTIMNKDKKFMFSSARIRPRPATARP